MKDSVFFLSILNLLLLCTTSLVADCGPIDIVYTWVDNADLRWQFARKREYRKFRQYATNDANTKMRFRNRDELKYSLRSLHKFVPFVRHIYIVTAGQIPSWYKPHPKISFVFHSTIFKHSQDLPTFNSHAIESNLHRIPGLSENYIYVNDDVFFASTLTRSDFFDDEGKMKLFLGDYITPSGPLERRENGWRAAWKNANSILDAHFSKATRKGFCTAPFAFNKSVVKKVEKAFQQEFAKVSSNKFRSRFCIAMTNGLIPYTAMYWGVASPGSHTQKTVMYGPSIKYNMKQLNDVKKSKVKTFAIEDSTTTESPELNQLLQSFLESMYPQKAPWEI